MTTTTKRPAMEWPIEAGFGLTLAKQGVAQGLINLLVQCLETSNHAADCRARVSYDDGPCTCGREQAFGAVSVLSDWAEQCGPRKVDDHENRRD